METTSIDPSIFKAYDVRGLYPKEVNDEAARLIARGFVALDADVAAQAQPQPVEDDCDLLVLTRAAAPGAVTPGRP